MTTENEKNHNFLVKYKQLWIKNPNKDIKLELKEMFRS